MKPHHAEQFARASRAIRASILTVLENVDLLCAIIDEVAAESITHHGRRDESLPSLISARGSELSLVIDRRMMVVRCDGRQCHLGYTLPFRVIERLAMRPNQYIRVDHLMADIWGGQRSLSAIRSVLSDLRARLTTAGMRELAQRIDGSVRGHYALLLDSR